MKTKKQFFKENWLIAIIWNIPISFFTSSFLSSILEIKISNAILIFIAIFAVLFINSIESWNNEERIKYLNDEIEKLKKSRE